MADFREDLRVRLISIAIKKSFYWKLLPYAKECAIRRPNTIVREDKAPAHNHYIQRRVFDAVEV